MTDSTGFPKTECIECGKIFKPAKTRQVTCSFECYKKYTANMKTINDVKKREKIMKEYMSHEWCKTNLGRLKKFYELFGEDFNCDICLKSFKDNLKEYGLPLHVSLQPGITDHNVLNTDNWNRYCTKCYCEIQFIKKTEHINDE